MTDYYGYGFPANFRNLVEGGNFDINPFQRGTSFTGITNTVTYTADRWFAVGGASSSISVSKQASTALMGSANALQFGRANGNANTAVISKGHILETADVIRLQGQQITFSFWALAGANWSPVNGNLNVQINSGTGTNEGAASMIAGTWAGFTSLAVMPNQITPAISGSSPTVAALPNIAQPISKALLQRYSFTTVVPANATELGVQLNATPVGTAGANDWVQLQNIQLELGSAATAHEFRDVQVELEMCQRFAWVILEPANNVLVSIGGTTAAANVQNFLFATPVQMRTAPTLTVTTGGFKIAAGAAAATATISAGTTHTPNQITVTAAVTQAIGQVAHLQGGGGAGSIVASADL